MKEETRVVTMRGNPLNLTGKEVKVGDRAPDFEVLDNTLARYVLFLPWQGSTHFLCTIPGYACVRC